MWVATQLSVKPSHVKPVTRDTARLGFWSRVPTKVGEAEPSRAELNRGNTKPECADWPLFSHIPKYDNWRCRLPNSRQSAQAQMYVTSSRHLFPYLILIFVLNDSFSWRWKRHHFRGDHRASFLPRPILVRSSWPVITRTNTSERRMRLIKPGLMSLFALWYPKVGLWV